MRALDGLAEVTLLDALDLFTFPQVAKNEKDDAAIELNPSNNKKRTAAVLAKKASNTKRDLTATAATEEEPHHHSLQARQAESSRGYNLTCDPKGNSKKDCYYFYALNYPRPSTPRTKTEVPITKPLVSCSDKEDDCGPNTKIQVITTNVGPHSC
ncbi:hypothetical protein BDV12DRAFT_198669 [Aspergillus spectabilis]